LLREPLLREPLLQHVSSYLLLLLLQEVQRPLLAAKIEAASARKGVGLVKVRCRQRCCLRLRLCFAASTWLGAALVSAAEFCMQRQVIFFCCLLRSAASAGFHVAVLLPCPSQVFGRRSGFIALQASLASEGVDICLIPEERFELDGPCGVLAYLKDLLERNGHAVICVAEGAGQDLMHPGGQDMSECALRMYF
jgi:hypothetical protein